MTTLPNLTKGEKIKISEKPSRLHFVLWYLLGAITLPFFGFGLLILIVTELHRNAHNYFITNKRIISTYFFLSKNTSSLSFNKIQDTHLKQSITDRLLGLGTVSLNSAGSSGIEIELRGLKNCEEIQSLINNKVV